MLREPHVTPSTQAPVLNQYSHPADCDLNFEGLPNPFNVKLTLSNEFFMETSKRAIDDAYGIAINTLSDNTLLGPPGNSVSKKFLIDTLSELNRLNNVYDIFNHSDFIAGLEIYRRIFLSNKCKMLIANTAPNVLFLLPLILAHKYINDTPLRNISWTQITNIDICMLNKKELEILMALEFDLRPSPNSTNLSIQ